MLNAKRALAIQNLIKYLGGFAPRAPTGLYPVPSEGLTAPPDPQLCFIADTSRSLFEKLNLLYKKNSQRCKWLEKKPCHRT